MTTEDASKDHAETSDLEQKIIRQIEYYFGDHNLPRDKFLQEKVVEDEGWVTLECLTTFNRLKILSPDHEVIVAAVRKSKNEIVEVSEDGKKIRRLPTKVVPEFTVEHKQDEKDRSVYCKGFPLDYSLEKLEEFFEDKGQIENILMRKDEEKKFKGSVFIKFQTVDGVKDFLALESVKCGDTELVKKSKEQYFQDKHAASKKGHHHGESQQKRKEKDEKDGAEIKQEGDKAEVKVEYEKGCVIAFKDVGEQTSREDVKELFKEEVAWVDFKIGDTDGFIRFNKEGGAEKALETIKKDDDGKITLRGVETSMRIIEGDEENTYWIKVQEDKAKARDSRNKGGQGRKRKKPWGKQRGGWHSKRSDGPPSKVKKE